MERLILLRLELTRVVQGDEMVADDEDDVLLGRPGGTFVLKKPLSLRCSSIMMPLLLDRRVSNSPGVVDKDARSQD